MFNKVSLISLVSLSIFGLNVVPTQANPTNIQTSEPSVTVSGDGNNINQTTYQYILNNPGRGIIKRNEPNPPQGRNNQVNSDREQKSQKESRMSQGSQNSRGRGH